jgi:beta-galactosidase
MFDFGVDARAEGGENGQNHKGLVTFDRKYKKDAFYAYKAWLSDEPFVHICGKRYVDRVEEVTKITVYSNQPHVELFANGISLGIQSSPEHFFYFNVPNAGETQLKAIAGDYTDHSFLRKVDTFNEAYRLKEKNAILNWFEVTAPEGYFSLNDTLEEITATTKGKMLFAGIAAKFMGSINKDVTAGMDVSEGMLKMMGSFTVLRLTSLMGAAGVKITKEQLLDINAKLNKIKKP